MTPTIKPVLLLLPLSTGCAGGGGANDPMVGQPVGDVGGGAEKLSVSGDGGSAAVLLLSPLAAVSSSSPQFVQKRIPSALSLPHFPHLIIKNSFSRPKRHRPYAPHPEGARQKALRRTRGLILQPLSYHQMIKSGV